MTEEQQPTDCRFSLSWPAGHRFHQHWNYETGLSLYSVKERLEIAAQMLAEPTPFVQLSKEQASA